MFYSRGLHNKISSLTYSEINHFHFETFCSVQFSFYPSEEYKKALATEMFKVKNSIAPEIIKELFALKCVHMSLHGTNQRNKRI